VSNNTSQFRSILLPLDRSPLAEQALAVVARGSTDRQFA
jgi:hypothetical protein